MPGFLTRTTAVMAVGVALLSGCSGGTDSPDSVSSVELQKGLVEKLAQTRIPTTWVNCPKDLPGKVGATTRCDVEFSSDNSVTALLTTTEVSGDTISWEITGPELTKDQVAKRVAGLMSAQVATCDSGLDGRSGDWVQCQVTRYGSTSIHTVEVKDVEGLTLNLGLTAVIPKQQLEESVLARLTPLYGRRPDSAECGGGLLGAVGETVRCTVTVGGNPDKFVARVTGASGGAVDFVVEKPPAR